MGQPSDFPIIFDQLKAILNSYETSLLVKANDESSYSLDTAFSQRFGKELFFGAVKTGKSYVSYHLMPIYIFPDLANAISPALKKRMQGKSCFNFTKIDEELLGELKDLTSRCFERCQQEKLV